MLVPGVVTAEVNFSRHAVYIGFDASKPIDMLALALAVENAGYSATWGSEGNTLCVIRVEGMTCGHCVGSVYKALEGVKEVANCSVSLNKHECYLIANKNTNIADVVNAIEAVGYLASVVHVNREVSLRILNWVGV